MTELHVGDCLELMANMPDKSVQLTFCSPPYEGARTYEIGFDLWGQDWVDWCVPRIMECLRVTNGLVAWVVEGTVEDAQWSATPALLMADLHRNGVCLRKPPIYMRHGIFGGGGAAKTHAANGGSADWLSNKYEFVVCCTAKPGKLPWADALALGHSPKFGAGGPPSHRSANGTRANGSKSTDRRPNGELKRRVYVPPKIANPGNVIDCGAVGGGHMGHPLAVENEAPFPVKLANFFVRSFCPPGGTVLDCFCGGGTTGQAALEAGRNFIGIDIRESQIELSKRRLASTPQSLFVENA